MPFAIVAKLEQARDVFAQQRGFPNYPAFFASLPPAEQQAIYEQGLKDQAAIDKKNAQNRAIFVTAATFGIGGALAAVAPSTPAPQMPPAQLPTQGAAPVSLLGNSGVASALGGIIGGFIPGVGTQAGSQLGSALSAAYGGLSEASIAQPVALPGVFGMGGAVSRAVPAIVGGVAATGVMAGRGVLAVARSAAAYCRRHPAWCASIGGIGAVGNLIQAGQLPTIKRRRARGISPSEFRGFRKVHRVLSGFCAPRMRVRRAARR